MSKQVLTETKSPQVFVPTKKTLVESSQPGAPGVYTVEGIFGKIDLVNENHRKYPRSVFEKNLHETSSFMQRLQSRRVLAELEHPESGSTHLERVSHLITAVWVETVDAARAAALKIPAGDYIFGRYEVLNTPRGNILRALHEANVDIGVSSRGRGDVVTEGDIDIVQDDYELDTFDAVYMPSVVEARPKPKVAEAAAGKNSNLREENGDLGSALPNAADTAASATAPAPAALDGAKWKKEAEEIIRALEDVISSNDKDLKALVELLPRGLAVVDSLSTVEDPEAVKFKSQATSLLRMLTNKIVNIETGKEKPTKKESITEGTLATLAGTIDQERKDKTNTRPMYRGDIESALNKAGQQITDTNVKQLADELRRKGRQVFPEKYESLREAEEADGVEHIPDGVVIAVCPKMLLKTIDAAEPATTPNENMQRLREWLAAQEADVLAKVCSRGVSGYIIQLVEPSVSGVDLFVKYNEVDQPSQEKDDMNLKAAVDALVAENKELKAKLDEAAKDTTLAARFAASKKLIEGFVRRLKQSEQLRLRESSRVKAAIRLIHKLNEELRKRPVTEATAAPGGKTLTEGATPRKEEEGKVTPTRVLSEESKERLTRLHEGAAAPSGDSENLMSRTVRRLG